jgi:poly(3-hydroxybutyrate) depolymerase
VAGRAEFTSRKFSSAPLSKNESTEISSLILTDFRRHLIAELQSQWKNKELHLGSKAMKFDYKVFGTAPAGGRSLFISMHGGGNTAPRVNDQQWQNQIKLYTPAEGIYLAPRAPTNTWNLWHEEHIDTLFDNLIRAAVLFEGVNPNKVYLMGYSAGGDGVYQLAPRMSDRFAAAAMMAGHPNETSPIGLRNIGFTLHMGALDNGFKRNEVAKKWAFMLDSLQKDDPEGYLHVVKIHEGRPHWMNRQDSVAVQWMAAFTRNIPAEVLLS